ncbi:MAG: nitrogen fixation protein [Sterolibacterium sp.]
MRIAVTSQNFKSVTGHAGRAHRFIVFEAQGVEPAREVDRLDLDETITIHGFDPRAAHPLDRMDVLITAGAGAGLIRRLAARGVLVVATDESDPVRAVEAYLSGHMKLATGGCSYGEAEHSCTCQD